MKKKQIETETLFCNVSIVVQSSALIIDMMLALKTLFTRVYYVENKSVVAIATETDNTNRRYHARPLKRMPYVLLHNFLLQT